MTPDELLRLECIFSSHEDFSVMESLYAGFDRDLNLLVLCRHEDDDHPENNRTTCAVVDKDEAYALSKKLGVAMRDLPETLADIMKDYRRIPCPMPSDVRRCFKDLTEVLLDEGCKMKVRQD